MTTQSTSQSNASSTSAQSRLVLPYVFFGDTCEQALNFYKDALGAEIGMLMRFKDAPEQPPEEECAPVSPEHIMHAEFRIGETTIMASDGCGEAQKHGGISLSVTIPNVDEARKAFEKLSQGGQKAMPFGPTFFAHGFGTVTDKFGIPWMIVTPK